jgi:hypothetical protein
MMDILAMRLDLDHHPCRGRDKTSKSAVHRECLTHGRGGYKPDESALSIEGTKNLRYVGIWLIGE